MYSILIIIIIITIIFSPISSSIIQVDDIHWKKQAKAQQSWPPSSPNLYLKGQKIRDTDGH